MGVFVRRKNNIKTTACFIPEPKGCLENTNCELCFAIKARKYSILFFKQFFLGIFISFALAIFNVYESKKYDFVLILHLLVGPRVQ